MLQMVKVTETQSLPQDMVSFVAKEDTKENKALYRVIRQYYPYPAMLERCLTPPADRSKKIISPEKYDVMLSM